MVIPRSINAHLVERFIFNFRLRPEALAQHLPAPYLKPQVFKGWSMVSFCILKLDHVILDPLPSFLGYPTISCAYRCGIIDTSGKTPEPSVYITDRNTDLPIISRLGPWVFADTLPTVRPSLVETGRKINIRINYLDNQRLFLAEAEPTADPTKLNSEVFDTVEDFARFMHFGVSSYTPSIYGDALVRVDLYKDDPQYRPLDATVDFSWLDGVWPEAGIVYDSAVRATGGLYKWTYRGLSLLDPNEKLLRPERLPARVFRGFRRVKAR